VTDRRALDQRIPEGDGAAETVKKGKRSQKTIFRAGIKHDGKLRNVTDDVVMGKNDSLGFTGTPAGEKENCFFMAALSRQTEPAS
jgi:hypothetical protein